MKVALFTHYADLYGANRSLLGLIDGLQGVDVEYRVFLPFDGPLVGELNARGIPFLIAPFSTWIREPFEFRHPLLALSNVKKSIGRLVRNLSVTQGLVKEVRAWGADLVHTNSAVTPIGALVAHVVGIPHVWHLREFCDLDYGVHFDYGKKVTVSCIYKSDAVIAVSNAIGRHYNNHAAAAKTTVIYNGILPREHFQFYKRRSLKKSDSSGFVFALVGLIHPAKGHSLALEAIAALRGTFPTVRLVIAGDGDDRELKTQVEELGISDHVNFLGFVSDPFSVYSAADAVLMCSKAEAMGRVTVEAMAAYRPVIASASGGSVELVKDGVTGLLFDGSSQTLARTMRSLMESPVLAASLADNAWSFARDNFCIEVYAEKVYNVYRRVLKKTSETAGNSNGK